MGYAIALDARLHAYLVSSEPPEHEELRKLRERTATMPNARLQIAPEQGHFLAFLVRLMGARRVLEIGTFTGYSALAMALALPADGCLVTCDVNEEWVDIGRPYWARAQVADKIDVRIGAALESLTFLAAGDSAFDLVFIDASKDEYDAYYEKALMLVRQGGLIVLDNMLQNGRVADPADSGPRTVPIRALNDKISRDERVDRVVLPVGDGMTLARPR